MRVKTIVNYNGESLLVTRQKQDRFKLQTFGEVLRVLRERKGWTGERLANEARVTQSLISKYEKGERLPKRSTITKLAQALGASPDNLLIIAGYLPQQSRIDDSHLDTIVATPQSVDDELDKEFEEILKRYRELDTETRTLLLQQLKSQFSMLDHATAKASMSYNVFSAVTAYKRTHGIEDHWLSRPEMYFTRDGVRLGDLLHPEFMQRYTKYNDFGSFFAASGMELDEFGLGDAFESEQFHSFVAKNSQFESFEDMLRTAVIERLRNI